MNETIKNILERRSIRSYTNTPIKDEDLDLIVECGKFAPTALDLQPWHFSLITDKLLLNKISEENKKILILSPIPEVQKMAEAPDYDCFNGAASVIIVSGDINSEYAAVDCAIAVENMAIAAQSLGLGSCFIGIFKVALQLPQGAYLLKEIGIPENYAPLYALSVGYSNGNLSERSPRKENTVNYVK